MGNTSIVQKIGIKAVFEFHKDKKHRKCIQKINISSHFSSNKKMKKERKEFDLTEQLVNLLFSSSTSRVLICTL